MELVELATLAHSRWPNIDDKIQSQSTFLTKKSICQEIYEGFHYMHKSETSSSI